MLWQYVIISIMPIKLVATTNIITGPAEGQGQGGGGLHLEILKSY